MRKAAVERAARPDRAVTASPSFSVKVIPPISDAGADDDDDPVIGRVPLSPPRGRERPCNVPDGDMRFLDVVVVVVDTVTADGGLDRSLPTTRSSKVNEFSTARDSEASELSRRGIPRSSRCRFHS